MKARNSACSATSWFRSSLCECICASHPAACTLRFSSSTIALSMQASPRSAALSSVATRNSASILARCRSAARTSCSRRRAACSGSHSASRGRFRVVAADDSRAAFAPDWRGIVGGRVFRVPRIRGGAAHRGQVSTAGSPALGTRPRSRAARPRIARTFHSPSHQPLWRRLFRAWCGADGEAPPGFHERCARPEGFVTRFVNRYRRVYRFLAAPQPR